MPRGIATEGTPPASRGDSRHRERVLAGMAAAVRETGFQGATVAAVVRHAGVSKRTFYEHFTDPVDCFLVLIESIGDRMLDAVAEAMTRDDAPLEERIERAVGVYLDLFASDPDLARSFWTELLFTGDRGRALTQRMADRTGSLLSDLAGEAHRADPSVLPLTTEAGTMLAAGIRELALLAHDGGRPLDGVQRTSVEMIRRAVGLTDR